MYAPGALPRFPAPGRESGTVELLNHIFQRRDADYFFESNVNGFAVGLNAVDSGFADVDFAGRGGISQVVHVNAF